MRELELLWRINELESQNRALSEENARLRVALGLLSKENTIMERVPDHLMSEKPANQTDTIDSDRPYSNESANETTTASDEKEINEIPTILPLVNKHSTPEEKIELFMSLFRGRADVYAKRCYSKKHESSYYIPACKNEWVRGVCDRARTKCRDCARRELLPLTKEVIDGHLRNRDEHGAGIVGIYPLLPDETCLV